MSLLTPAATNAMVARPVAPTARPDAARLLARLTAEMPAALRAGRAFLLGSRPANDRTCVTEELHGNRLRLQGSARGGIGLRIAAAYGQSPRLPLDLYNWHQNDLRRLLEVETARAASAAPRAEALAKAAARLARAIHAGSLPPAQPPAALPAGPQPWPAVCLAKLHEALAAEDRPAAGLWADELAAATFALADLHRWATVLLDAHQAALDFQARCREGFAWADAVARKHPGAVQESSLPVAHMMVAWLQNYLEVEHQAEGLYWPAPEAVSAAGRPLEAPAARWMPPRLREAFLALRRPMGPTLRKLWDTAAAAPYERSYLANILFRADASGSIPAVGEVLRRYERRHPGPDRQSLPELMDVLAYRAGLYSSGFRWADRYDPRILEAAGRITGDQEAAARRAHHMANDILAGWKNYAPDIMTLADALDRGRLDCVRGTDLIGALYRGAGHGNLALIRLTCGTVGHSVAAVPVRRGGRSDWLVLDCLDPAEPAKTYPAAWFDGLTWPEGYPGPTGPLLAVELCLRGLDGYVFAEGYVASGPAAGERLRAALPYLPGRARPGQDRLYAPPTPPGGPVDTTPPRPQGVSGW